MSVISETWPWFTYLYTSAIIDLYMQRHIHRNNYLKRSLMLTKSFIMTIWLYEVWRLVTDTNWKNSLYSNNERLSSLAELSNILFCLHFSDSVCHEGAKWLPVTSQRALAQLLVAVPKPVWSLVFSNFPFVKEPTKYRWEHGTKTNRRRNMHFFFLPNCSASVFRMKNTEA